MKYNRNMYIAQNRIKICKIIAQRHETLWYFTDIKQYIRLILINKSEILP